MCMFSLEIFMIVEARVPLLPRLFLLLFFLSIAGVRSVALAGNLEGVGQNRGHRRFTPASQTVAHVSIGDTASDVSCSRR